MSCCVEVRRARPLLGTIVEVTAGGASRRRLIEAVDGAFARVQRVHALMSFHGSDSDVSRLNREAHRRSVAVHPWTHRVLRAAQRIAARTDGLFDCTVAPSLVRWGYLPQHRFGRATDGTWRDIACLSGRRVRFRRPVCIDLGGIAKGFAVDQAVEALQRRGAAWGCVNAGGDARVFGRRRHTVHLRDPIHPGAFHVLRDLPATALATSATYFSRKRLGRRRLAPIVHPSTDRPYDSAASVSVFASRCLVADALTKPVLLSDRPDAILQRFNARAVVLTPAAARSGCSAS